MWIQLEICFWCLSALAFCVGIEIMLAARSTETVRWAMSFLHALLRGEIFFAIPKRNILFSLILQFLPRRSCMLKKRRMDIDLPRTSCRITSSHSSFHTGIGWRLAFINKDERVWKHRLRMVLYHKIFIGSFWKFMLGTDFCASPFHVSVKILSFLFDLLGHQWRSHSSILNHGRWLVKVFSLCAWPVQRSLVVTHQWIPSV